LHLEYSHSNYLAALFFIQADDQSGQVCKPEQFSII
jgi:hypothetical protein